VDDEPTPAIFPRQHARKGLLVEARVFLVGVLVDGRAEVTPAREAGVFGGGAELLGLL
jgi:hypothetical protein